jgi:hypothetical protein
VKFLFFSVKCVFDKTSFLRSVWQTAGGPVDRRMFFHRILSLITPYALQLVDISLRSNLKKTVFKIAPSPLGQHHKVCGKSVSLCAENRNRTCRSHQWSMFAT